MNDEDLAEGTYSQKLLHVVVHRKDGSSFDNTFFIYPGKARITILDQPRPLE